MSPRSARSSTSALVDARPSVLWLDVAGRPPPSAPLSRSTSADLVIVGAGFTGLWAAIRAKERDPSLDVVVIDAGRVGAQASGRNGGFCSASVTHGLANGVERFGDEMELLQRLGRDNFEGLVADVGRYGIECHLELTGNLELAVHPWLVDGLRKDFELQRDHGEDVTWLDTDAARSEVDSATYRAGLWRRSGEAMLDPAQLAWGLADVARSLGVRICEGTAMTSIERGVVGLVIRCVGGARDEAVSVRTERVLLGTNAARSPVRAINRRIAPVYDHVLATEPLSTEQLDRIGWRNRQGLADTTNLFHYYRLTADDRILWGGYDAVYHFGNRIAPELEQRDATHELLAQQFYETFPQLRDVSFTHRWGGVIDTCTRFAVGFGTGFDGRLTYAAGYTGLGVGATRFAADVCLDLLYDHLSERARTEFVQKRPLPFPGEPLRWIGISITRKELARADRNRGRRGLWLRALDAVGLGFDS